jgi:hypothetical protein
MEGENILNTSLEKVIFDTMTKARDVIHIRAVLENIKLGATSPPSLDLITLAASVTRIVHDIERKIDYLNKVYTGDKQGTQENPGADKEKEANAGCIGTKLWNSCRRAMDNGSLHYILVPNLIDFAYGRALNHFAPTGEYLPQFKGIDDGLVNFPVQLSLFTSSIATKGKNRLNSPQTKRLLVFLSYLRASEIDQELNVFESYDRFEKAIAFCQAIPEQYRGILNIKKTTFNDDWRKYKLFLKEKHSEYYKYVEETQTFEKDYPNLHRTMQVYILYKKIIHRTTPFQFNKQKA